MKFFEKGEAHVGSNLVLVLYFFLFNLINVEVRKWIKTDLHYIRKRTHVLWTEPKIYEKEKGFGKRTRKS